MDMGVLKPFESNRTTSTAVPVEAGLGHRSVAKQAEVAMTTGGRTPVDTLSSSAVQQGSAVEREELNAAVADMQNYMQSVNREINFQLDDASGKVVINVTESRSGNVIRQIPSEEALRIAENLEEVRSLLFKAEA